MKPAITQTTDTILMIRPVRFRMNEQTAVNNYFQKEIDELNAREIQQKAVVEFDQFVEKLIHHDINVLVIEDTEEPGTPDSIFPNNWVSFHQEGTVGLYPMFAENRRYERRMDILERLKSDFMISRIVDFSASEQEGLFLEGTGSLVLDRPNKLAYAALSERTQEPVIKQFCDAFDYQAITFIAYQTVDGQRLPIYHTNVMMSVADKFAILCADSIDDESQRKRVIDALETSGKEVIKISEEQKENFAGNMLQVVAKSGQLYLVMSDAAFISLKDQQVATIEKYCNILHSPLDTIETLGGGSARCMMAEVFLPKNK